MNRFLRVGVLIISLSPISPNVFVLAQDNQAKENSAKASTVEPQTDLSGTYEGVVDYPEGGLRSGAILTIEGDKFWLSARPSESTSAEEIEGSIIINTTATYIAAALVLGNTTPPTIISVRALLKDGDLTLVSVPGEKRAFSFTGHVKRRSRRRSKHRVPEGEIISPAPPAKIRSPGLSRKHTRPKPHP